MRCVCVEGWFCSHPTRLSAPCAPGLRFSLVCPIPQPGSARGVHCAAVMRVWMVESTVLGWRWRMELECALLE